MERRPNYYGTESRYDIEEQSNFLESRSFLAYEKWLLRKITRLQKSTIGQQKRSLGKWFRERWHQDALQGLMGSGLITTEWGWLPTKYVPSTPYVPAPIERPTHIHRGQGITVRKRDATKPFNLTLEGI